MKLLKGFVPSYVRFCLEMSGIYQRNLRLFRGGHKKFVGNCIADKLVTAFLIINSAVGSQAEDFMCQLNAT